MGEEVVQNKGTYNRISILASPKTPPKIPRFNAKMGLKRCFSGMPVHKLPQADKNHLITMGCF